MTKIRLIALGLLIGGFAVAYFSFGPSIGVGGYLHKHFPIQLGLDLQGGTHLVYHADTSKLPKGEVKESMGALRDVIERRVNMFGVSEPLVQTSSGGLLAGNASQERLIVELPGVTDLKQAKAMIGKTPVLDFRVLRKNASASSTYISEEAMRATTTEVVQADDVATTTATSTEVVPTRFVRTSLTGRYLSGADLRFDNISGQPIVSLKFNDKGTELFSEITTKNVGQVVAIFLDGAPISTPVVNEPITSGEAVISGNFRLEEAKTLVGRLNAGALPVPITLLSSQTVGATLGAKAFAASVFAGIIAFFLVAFFMILWYRLPGLIAVVALAFYVAINVAFYRLIPVTLTAAGIAGFILSIGMAVDANILIFERLKEELRKGESLYDATHIGFSRAWLAIRDSHISSIITAIVLYWMGTSVVKGFALVFGIGVLVSLFSAVTMTRIFLFSAGVSKETKVPHFFFKSGFSFLRKKKTESET